DLRAPTPSVAAELAVFDFYGEVEYIDNIKQGIENKIAKLLQTSKQSISGLVQVIIKTMELKLGIKTKELETSFSMIDAYMARFIEDKKTRLNNLVVRLEKSNPLSILKSGYSKVLKEEKSVSIEDISVGDKIKTILDGGYVFSVVEEVKENKK
ncbi:MAG: hypothetical protein IJB98_00610, partial [Clostridia bacterium]|nr:hypothetical protein [Clostridia bacterium]